MRFTLVVLVPLLASAAGAGGADSLAWVSDAGGVVTRDARGSVTAVDLRTTWAGDSDLASLAALPAMTRLDLSETRITDHGLRQLKNAHAIRDLNLRYAELITDEGIAAMKTWKHLTRLNLEGTKITDSALQQLSTFTSLEALNIGSVQVTDAGLESLTSLTNLRELTIGGNKLTDAGLQALRQLPGLTLLNLGGVQRTDSGPWSVSLTQPGLEAIATLKALRRLRLQQTLISARGLDTIKGLTHLELLDLHNCGQIGDDALPALAGMPALRVLDLTDTKVSATGLEKLKRDRPGCRILHAASTPKHDAGTVEMN
jgi:internalin A